MREVFGYDTRMLGADELRRDYVDEPRPAARMLEPEGVGVHPLKLAFGYLRDRARAGRQGAPGQPGAGCRDAQRRALPADARRHGARPRGAASPPAATPATACTRACDSKIMPILSNSLVTRPLTPAELAATNFRSTTFITDTRTLRFYYRMLPDNRVQIGSRSSITGADATDPRHMQVLVDGLHRKFPALERHRRSTTRGGAGWTSATT